MKILEIFKKDDPRPKEHLWFFLGAYFLVQFAYPLVRAASTTMFIEDFGAKSSPLAWLLAVLFLIISIFLCNKFQARHNVQSVFFWVSLISASIFGISLSGHLGGIKIFTFLSFIWKEIYIVIQIHLLLGYANNYFRKDEFKQLIGLVGAVGSVGGIFGGLTTSLLGHNLGTNFVAGTALVFVFLPALLFKHTPGLNKISDMKRGISPLGTIQGKDLRQYVLLIALIVMLTQFIINIADFNFNIAFEKAVTNSSERTGYLGSIYTLINLLTFMIQFFLMPFILPRISEKTLHLFIPISYLVLTLALMTSSGGLLIPLAGFYVYLKSSDYSLFSGGKELLYQSLNQEQKYGAKYLTDMLTYRASKALIAAVLIYLQSSYILNMMMIIFLVVWLILVIRLFGIHRKLFT